MRATFSGELFQFQTGAIKSPAATLNTHHPLRFNSKLVRLKAEVPSTPPQRYSTFQFQTGAIKSGPHLIQRAAEGGSFNSKLVRLKACSSVPGPVPPRLFQFQTGAIKSAAWRRRLGACALFQFQTGAIKSRLFWRVGAFSFAFQFQTGAIKSCGLALRIAALGPVSIPNWCD